MKGRKMDIFSFSKINLFGMVMYVRAVLQKSDSTNT